MLSQEDIYQLMFKEDWTTLLDMLHRSKKLLASDPMLSAAASQIEKEFLRKLPDYPLDREDVIIQLETLYQLDHGKFYVLSEESRDMVFDALAVRKPEKYRYFSKAHRKRAEAAATNPYVRPMASDESAPLPDNWLEIYNRLFELMDVKSDAACYFSGPRFIKAVQQYRRYFPDYIQFINSREAQGKSTTRKIFFFDILKELTYNERKGTIDYILEILRPFHTDYVAEIELLLYNKKPSVISEVKAIGVDKPIVFISYSWDDEVHKKWVLDLANRLVADGVDVKIDRLLRPGASLQYFMEQSIAKSSKVMIVFTPAYKAKADQRQGGVGYEYSILNASLYNNQTVNEKIIPLLRRGSKTESIPEFMQQYIHIDLRNDEQFETSYGDLKREIFNEPAF